MPSEDYADGPTHSAEFVRATRLYDLDRGESVSFDWSRMQPLAESQNEVERAVAGVLDGRDVEQTG